VTGRQSNRALVNWLLTTLDRPLDWFNDNLLDDLDGLWATWLLNNLGRMRTTGLNHRLGLRTTGLNRPGLRATRVSVDHRVWHIDSNRKVSKSNRVAAQRDSRDGGRVDGQNDKDQSNLHVD